MLEERFRKAQTLPGYSKDTLYHSCLKKPSSDKSIFRSKCVQHHTYSTIHLQDEELKLSRYTPLRRLGEEV
jgi:hypothetical protein